MIVILAINGSVKNGTDSVAPIIPNARRITFAAPFSLNTVFILNNVTNCGTATERTNINLQKPFAFVPLRLINNASKSPPTYVVSVANTAQISVQPSTGQNVFANAPEPENKSIKF